MLLLLSVADSSRLKPSALSVQLTLCTFIWSELQMLNLNLKVRKLSYCPAGQPLCTVDKIIHN